MGAMASALVVTAIAALIVVGCGDDTDTSATTTSEDTTTTAAVSSTTAEALTLGTVIDGIDQELADRFPDAPPGQIVCAEPDEMIVGRATVLYCDTETPPGFEEGTFVIVVVDDAGTAAYTAATDMVDLHTTHGPGLLCRDVLALPYLTGTTPEVAYLFSLSYWFQDGEPDRMDADGNGAPCETLFEPEVVEAVWSGGWVG